ncbi:MAG: ribonuclease III [Oscillospiraceae bacterium]|nr:ribonuclease III [Oscillospiraceae bacterium]
MDVKELQNRIGYVFRNEELMENALTHSSYANERGKSRVFSNERLEFLGDSVLGFVTAEYLFEKYPSRPEGEMTRIRAELVCEHSLAATAEELELGAVLLLGKGEEQNGGRRRRSILADAVEALLAAIYLDGGMEPARAFVLDHILDEKPTELTDYKTALQERVQAAGGVSPQYRIIDEYGPDHAKTFVARVEIDGESAGEGSGRTKKEAEQSAARAAMESMDK